MSAEVKQDKVPLSRVVLYKHGVGFFERRGRLTGPAQIELSCRAEEIDDMLKSLLVLSVGGGRVSEITYECSKTLETRLAEFGFDIKRCSGLVDLVGQLKGTPVTVEVSGQSVGGRVIGLDQVDQIVGDVKLKDQQLVLYTDDHSFKRYSLSAISSIRVEDAKIAAEIKEQLQLLFEGTTRKDAKHLLVHLEEEQEREVIIAYSIPAPIWKTSYRLVFLSDGRLLIQGMAIVDNVQDEDWADVEITLVSAAPISFIQPLYDPIQPYRRTIEAQGIASAGPVVAERAQKVAAESWGAGASPPPRGAAVAGLRAAFTEMPAFGAAPMAGALMEELESAELPVSTEEAGELFEYRIGTPVTVPSNTSALIPIVNEAIEGERISLYNGSRNVKHPYATVRLKNTTGLTLEGGPVTVMEEDSYAGEGLLDVLKPGDTRFLPYALDQGVHVIVRSDHQRRPLWRVRISQGFLYMDYRERYTQTYHLDNVSGRPKVVFIEHPVVPGMKLVGPDQPAETTQSYHRFRVELAEKEQKPFQVVEETDSVEHVRLDHVDSVDPARLETLLAQNVLDRKFVEFLQVLLHKRQDIIDLRETKRQAEAQLVQYEKDQERARENIKTLGTSSERYRKAIDQAEDRIMETRAVLKEILENMARLEREYAHLVAVEMMQELELRAGKRG
ncbi:MAG TPA: hypothetical protein V6D08_05360 [Candidatus Obscuribacterales bacterium]